jgi:DNA-binding winged helix-turn-helix (wHTH) protein
MLRMFIPIIDNVEIDRETRSVRKGGEQIHLTALEYGLLDYLSAHANRLCKRQELLDYIWGANFQYDTGTIDVHLHALRRKLGWTTKHPIEAVRGAGLILRIDRAITHYTINLQTFFARWLSSHEMELTSRSLVPQLNLTPFVKELTIESEALRRMLDGILESLLPFTHPGVLNITTRLTMRHFTLTLDINGIISELRIPVNTEN